jgi:hypothetical protein
MPDALYELGVCLPAEIVDELLALLAVVRGDADLHQLVLIEGDAELGEHSVAHPGGADTDHRLQVVGAGTQRAPLFSRVFFQLFS